MSEYRAPVRDMQFVIDELAGLERIAGLPGFDEVSSDLVAAVLDEASQLASEIIAPTNRLGDERGAQLRDGQVTVPVEFRQAYEQFTAGGWPGLAMSPEFGGQGLPAVVGVAVEEMLQSANLAWSLCPLLTQGAIHALESHGTPELKQRFLAPMISGKWTGTMNLTEPQAGSDLSLVRCQAVPANGAYHITGQKIFITWGDHDMTPNIIHLVLARLPDAASGVKGLSLFLVPKYLVDAEGKQGQRNGVTTASLEHKLGIHASPTCVLDFNGAEGYLVGAESAGLACMFTMMNSARLSVGLQGVAIAERAYQRAVAFAMDRKQGNTANSRDTVAIIAHPDVRRMLMTMKAETEAMRAVAYVALAHLDIAARAAEKTVRDASQARVDLLTPIVKGWSTETAQVLTSLGIQVHGGMGYVEETGAAQYLRDARILTIYEGTTGIQANDLIGRKMLRDGGKSLSALLDDIHDTVTALSEVGGELAVLATELQAALEQTAGALEWLLANSRADADIPGAVAYHFLMLLGTLTGGWQLGQAALAAQARLERGAADGDYCQAKVHTARFYAEQILPRVAAHARSIRSGSAATMSLTPEQFFRD